jgi:hypothetical protein
METAQVPVDGLHWVLAILPVVVLLVFRTLWHTVTVACGKVVWDAI